MKRLKSILPGSMRLSILLLICIFLMVGTTWARYQSKESQLFNYELRDYAFVYLWHSYDEGTGTFRNQQSTWQSEGDWKTLDFCISNGTAEDFAEEDQWVNIRLLVSLGAWGETEEVEVLLNFPQSGESFPGKVQPIMENSPVHSTFGAGWVITFCDVEGEEIGWILNGTELSILEAQIAVRNMKLGETTLMQLQVIGDTSI